MQALLEKPKYYENDQSVHRGEIWFAKLPDSGGSVQKGERPFLIIGNEIGNRYSPVVIGLPITSKVKKDMPTHIKLNADEGLYQTSYVLGEQILTIPKTELKTKITKISNEKLFEVESVVQFSLGIKPYRFNILQPR